MTAPWSSNAACSSRTTPPAKASCTRRAAASSPRSWSAHAWRSLELTPGHHDLDWIGRHRDGRIVVPEPFLIGTATALTTRHFGRVSANLGWLDVVLPAPVFAGDTMEAESTVLATRESRSRPDEGIVTVATETRNQHGEPVLRFRRNLLVYRRHAAGMSARAGLLTRCHCLFATGPG